MSAAGKHSKRRRNSPATSSYSSESKSESPESKVRRPYRYKNTPDDVRQLCIEQVDKYEPRCHYDSEEECEDDPISMEMPIRPVRIRNQHKLQCVGIANLHAFLSEKQRLHQPLVGLVAKTPLTRKQIAYVNDAYREIANEPTVYLQQQYDQLYITTGVSANVEIPRNALKFFRENVWRWNGAFDYVPRFISTDELPPDSLYGPPLQAEKSDGDIDDRLTQIKRNVEFFARDAQRQAIDQIMARGENDRDRIYLWLVYLFEKAIPAIPTTALRRRFVNNIYDDTEQPDKAIVLQWVRESFSMMTNDFYAAQPLSFWNQHYRLMNSMVQFIWIQKQGNPLVQILATEYYKNLYWYLFEEQARNTPPQAIFPQGYEFLNATDDPIH